MEERRRIDRVGYQAKSVIVVCDTVGKHFCGDLECQSAGHSLYDAGRIS
ncbi:MAG: hypothetical protein ACLVGL_08960 [Waltera sp.]